MTTLEESYRYCRHLSRSRARNFYYSFLLLPRAKRDAMCAIYSFMRECDDLSDEPGATHAALEDWRRQLNSALDGAMPDHPIWPAFADTVARFRIPPKYFHEMIDGVTSDLDRREISTFEELYHYCYLVASVVGLTVIHVFEFSDPRALVLAEKCGIAFQLTNIIRDVREDAARGRVYIPGIPAQVASTTKVMPHLQTLGKRARAYYQEARPLIDLVNRDSRPSLWALMEIYRRLLNRLEKSGYAVLEKRIRLTAFEKLMIVVRAWTGAR